MARQGIHSVFCLFAFGFFFILLLLLLLFSDLCKDEILQTLLKYFIYNSNVLDKKKKKRGQKGVIRE